MDQRTESEQGLVDAYLTRTLDASFPELEPYLRPRLTVLDVGCGPGSITLGVAHAVKPGQVVGIDHIQSRVDVASRLAKERGVDNVAFRFGDALHLEFPNDTFDVVYSHTVLHEVIDPIHTLREQKRVAKPGGWVIAAGVRDYGVSPRYPACPAYEKAHDAFTRYWQAIHQQYLAGQLPAGTQDHRIIESDYADLHAGRKCMEWFVTAGLTQVTMDVKVVRTLYPGADRMALNPLLDAVPPLDEPDHFLNRVWATMIAAGYLDESTFKEAQQELVEWYRHPHAFHFYWYTIAAGKA